MLLTFKTLLNLHEEIYKSIYSLGKKLVVFYFVEYFVQQFI